MSAVVNEPIVNITFSELAIDNDINPDLLIAYAKNEGIDDPEEG